MALTRSEYVEICSECKKRAFDKKLGLICSLTGQHAVFENSCPNYELDPNAVKQSDRIKGKQPNPIKTKKSPVTKIFFILGIILFLGSTATLIWALSIGFFSWGLLMLIFLGIILMARSLKGD